MIDGPAVIEIQRGFYVRGEAGCLFAARAAADPDRYGWRFTISESSPAAVGTVVEASIANPNVSSQSIIFPAIRSAEDLVRFLRVLPDVPRVSLAQEVEFEEMVCLGYRVDIGEARSYVSGFAALEFLPKTRRAPFAEITFRTKPRPPYKEVMKEAPAGVVHLADMDMRGMSKKEFTRLWGNSHSHVNDLLGAAPDLRAAAKTTFAIPTRLWHHTA